MSFRLIAFLSVFVLQIFSYAEPTRPLKRNWFLVGGDFMYQMKEDTKSPEIDNDGLGLGGKVVWSRFNKKWVSDIGLGYRYDKMEKSGVEVTTNAFYWELGLRYRLSTYWSVGPEIHMLTGSDVSFSDVGTNSDEQNIAFFGGARIMKDTYFGKENNILRLGVQALTDLDISSRQVTYLQAVAEYGWPEQRHRKPKKERKQPKLKLDLRNVGVNFDTGSSQLTGESFSVIKKLAEILKKYESQWDSVHIDGHTDIKGNYDFNKKLSVDRAEAVRYEFLVQGITEKKIDSQGFGPDELLDKADTPEAHAKNRRVELHLEGEKASRAFIEELEALLKN